MISFISALQVTALQPRQIKCYQFRQSDTRRQKRRITIINKQSVETRQVATLSSDVKAYLQKSNTNAPKAPTAKPKLSVEGDSLETKPEHVAHIIAFVALSVGTTVHTITSVSTELVIPHVTAAVLAYLFTDFAVGVYHHAVDNYGSANTPIVGCKSLSHYSACVFEQNGNTLLTIH